MHTWHWHTWHWHTWDDRSYLTCDLLADWQHGFFTRQFEGRSPADLTPILHPGATVHRIRQVHGNIVLHPSETADRSEIADTDDLAAADGLVSEQANQAVWVCSADCTPVLIADARTGQVAAIHAGWRGTALKIVPQAIARLQAQGSQLPDLRVALGPAIAGEVYQVSESVAIAVGATVAQFDPDPLDAALSILKQLPNSPILPDPEPGRVRLDVRRVIALQLEHLGFAPEQVAIAPHCTYQNEHLFFSYRRNREKKVQWSGIVSSRL